MPRFEAGGGSRRRAFTAPMLLLVAGCTAGGHQIAADRAAKAVLAGKRTRVPEVHGSMDVDRADERARPARTLEEVSLDLQGALCLAAEASRDFRQARETAYLVALSFTGTRHEFEWRPSLGGDVAVDASRDSTTVSGGPQASVSRRLERGGSFVLNLATEFLRSFRGDPIGAAVSVLSAELLLPLGRGGGLAARETLTQAELDVLYALRDYARFQQEFAVRIATTYYRVLALRDTVENAETSYESLEQTYERARSFGPEGEGRLPDFQVDQAKQDLLRAEERRIQSRQSLEAALDSFKQDLGLPVTTRLHLPEDALAALRTPSADPAPETLGPTIATALERRVDLKTARDRLRDAARKVAVAADALGAQADLTLSGSLTGPDDRPVDVRGVDPSARVGLDLDLPVDRVNERNAYRSAQVAVLGARRAVEALEDSIVASVRQAFRTLEQARQSQRIQQEGVRLAGRRVESANLNLELGRATIRDRLDAEESLTQAKDALTQALLDHAVARLELERDTGTLLPSSMLTCPPGASAGVAPCAPSAARAAAAPPPRAPAVAPGGTEDRE